MNRPSLAMVLLFVLTATVAVAQIQEQPPPSQGTDLASSNCYKCHASGGGNLGPPLRAQYSVTLGGSANLALNQPLTLSVTVRNAWVAELRDLSATVDFTNASDAGFTSRPPPALGITSHGTLPFDPTQPLRVQGERASRVTVSLPIGATAFSIRLIPDNQTGNSAPDLILRLWAPATDTKGTPTATVNNAGKGGNEHFSVIAARSALRSGTWTAEVAQEPCTQSPDASCLQPQGFAVVGDAWFNLTGGDRTQTVPFPATSLDGQHQDTPQSSTVAWTYFLRDYTHGNESIAVTVNATAHYQHPPNAARYDDWPYTQRIVIPLKLLPSGGNLTLPSAPPATATNHTGSITMAQVGEAVGYLGSFTLVVSMTSGGAFGNRTKAWMNKLYGEGKRRIAFHNVFSYGVITFAVVHMVLFLIEAEYHWSVGLLWGAPAILFMLLLGVTGAFQGHIMRWWGSRAWTVIHASLSHLTILFTLVHMGLDGAHFTWIPKDLHWTDPVVKALRG